MATLEIDTALGGLTLDAVQVGAAECRWVLPAIGAATAPCGQPVSLAALQCGAVRLYVDASHRSQLPPRHRLSWFLFVPLGLVVQVNLLYLRSWRGMGQAQVECAAGCSCDKTVLDAHWDREATLTDLTTLRVSGVGRQGAAQAARHGTLQPPQGTQHAHAAAARLAAGIWRPT